MIDVLAEQAPGLHQALERGMLTGRWRTLQHITASPGKIGDPAGAGLVLTHFAHVYLT